MDEFIGNLVKFLSSTVIVRILSYPNFAIEILLASVVCVVHCLLIFEVNTLVRRTNAKAAARLRLRHPIKESETCSFHSLVTLQTTHVLHKRPEVFQRSQMYSTVNTRLPKRFSRSNISWMLSKGDSVGRHKFSDRVEHLLSISPSEYVRRDKERKSREQGLRSCIQSLTSLLEKALNNDSLDVQNMSKDDIRKSINTLRENFENQLVTNYQLGDFPSASLQSLIGDTNARKAFKNALSPNLISSIYHASNISFSKSNYDTRAKRRKEREDDEKSENSKLNLSVKSSDSLSELFRKQSQEQFHCEKRYSRGMLVN